MGNDQFDAGVGFDLECRNVTRRFGSFTAVDDVSFGIPKGSFFSILGPSGCGKTTLLRMIAGFLAPDEGDIQIKGKSVLNVPPNRRPVNMVFQHLALFPMMTVAENVAYGLRRRGVSKADIPAKVQRALDRVSLPDAGPKRVDQLSGGQKQRVAIARSMVLDPDVLLLDEPLGALDLKLREHMKVELKRLQSEFDTTFIYITHDQSEALVMSDNVAVMNAGQFEQVGSPQSLYYDPTTAFVASFVGDSNRWRGKVEDVDAKGVKVTSDDGLTFFAEAVGNTPSKGDKVDIFVRPEAVVMSRPNEPLFDGDNSLKGTVSSVLFNGANSRALLRDSISGDEIMVALPQTGAFHDLVRGEEVSLSWNRSKAKCFPAMAGDVVAAASGE
jgi:spermidine/putrescine transport system ATP-binding protein